MRQQTMSSEAFLQAVYDTGADPGRKPYLLVDHAGAPGLLAQLQRKLSTRWTSLFEGSKEENAIDAAPILIQLRERENVAEERSLLVWLRRSCEFSTSLTVLHSVFSHEDLARALRHRLDALLPDSMSVLLRYFDTRILESLLQVLTPEQREQFLAIASCWQWIDRGGALRRQGATQLDIDTWPRTFELNVEQQNALIDASLPDTLVQQMYKFAPDLCRGKTRAALHVAAADCVPKLTKIGLDDLRTQTLYCLTALQLGPAFDHTPEWEKLMERVTKKQLSFEAALKEAGV